ncbi:hypothetical protein TRFO_19778 [Tritrichomonas foetus]|uniref:Uncharacterized protein n=1 Tax=Tritrichomonas foetus TaxID=1144522 RepID=A0A1J4KHG2_9EUKA|nr:hypothetical protein TRFO_19778 [Tritrichomonas foetus]|eukprot:OHT10809.1 hypothetical protein TRFO_19778 [Tritrichomonas foetus]
MNSTPKRGKTKPSQTCSDVEEEFSRRFLSLFTSLYDTPSADAVQSFPPVARSNSQAPSETKSKLASNPPPFNATVWDLRLKKTVDNQILLNEEASELVSQNLDSIEEMLAENNEKVQDVFQADKAERADVPKYLQNFQNQLKIDRERKRGPPAPLNIPEAERQFNQRLQKQKQREIERKKRMKERQAQQAKEHMDFLKSLPKTRKSENKMPTAQSENKARHERALELLKKRREGVSSTKSRTKSNKESAVATPKTPKVAADPMYYDNGSD